VSIKGAPLGKLPVDVLAVWMATFPNVMILLIRFVCAFAFSRLDPKTKQGNYNGEESNEEKGEEEEITLASAR
jgi:hypothetical protein